MKVLIIGQCQGGNAKTWQEFLDDYSELDLVHYVCRNYCQQNFKLKSKNKKIIEAYNFFKKNSFLNKVWTKLMSSYFLPVLIRVLDKVYSYDIIHVQGNYEPMFNLSIMKSTNAKSVLHIYGSDFYQKFKNGDNLSKKHFKKVVDFSDHILFNFEVLKNDFLKEINCSEKVSVGCMGVNDFWADEIIDKKDPSDKVIRFLSARGMYAYNNIDLLVDSFIELYGNNADYELYLINGYGWDTVEKDFILHKVKDYSNIIPKVGVWVTDEELREFYDLCDYNFCIGSTDQLTVSIIYGYLRGCLNILSPLDNYSELETLNFKSHKYLKGVSKQNVFNLLKNLPLIDDEKLTIDCKNAKFLFLFRNRFKNTLHVYDTLKK